MDRKDMAAKAALVVVMVGMATGGAYASEKLFDLAHETDQQTAQIDQLSRSLDASRQQLQVNGITPTVPSAHEVLKGALSAPSRIAGASATVDRRTGHGTPAQGALGLVLAATDPRRKP